jgi:hypothetical protein
MKYLAKIYFAKPLESTLYMHYIQPWLNTKRVFIMLPLQYTASVRWFGLYYT